MVPRRRRESCAHNARTNGLQQAGRTCQQAAYTLSALTCKNRGYTARSITVRYTLHRTANAVWVYSPSGVQIPEPPPLTRRGQPG